MDASKYDEGRFKKHRWSCRFVNQTVEDAFTSSRADSMRINISRGGLTVALAYAHPSFVLASRYIEGLTMGKIVAASVAGMCFLGFTQAWLPYLRGFRKLQSLRIDEVIVITTMLWHMVNVILWDPPTIKILSGEPLDEEDLATIDWRFSQIALNLDCAITLSHLALPCRWYLMFWVDVLYIVGITAIYPLLAFEQGFQTLLVSWILTGGACVGLRGRELKERLLFAALIDERTLRVEAEFAGIAAKPKYGCDHCSKHKEEQDASKAGESVAERSHIGTKTSPNSIPETTHTGEVFKSVIARPTQSLDEVIKLAEQEQWLIGKEQLSIFEDKPLGKGGFGTVCLGSYLKSPVAVKSSVGSNVALASIFNEIRILRHVRHPGIVLFHGACLDRSSGGILLVLEQVKGEPLNEYVTKLQAWRKSSPSAPKQMSLMLDLCQALIYLHSRKPCIVHADITPGNVLVEMRWTEPSAKLLDFGISRAVTRDVQKIKAGTPRFFAPEFITDPGRRPSPEFDAFSVGRVLFLVAAGRKPLAALDDEQVIAAARSGTVPELAWAPTTRLLELWRPVVEACTNSEPGQRPDMETLHMMLAETVKMFKREQAKASGADGSRSARTPAGGKAEARAADGAAGRCQL